MASARPSIAQLLQQGQVCHQQGQWDLAAAHYREIIERQPHNFDALHLLGILTLQSGDPANAAALLKRAATANPANASIQSLIGIALQGSGQSEAAVEYFERAVKLQPANAELHYNLGKALRKVEKFESACASYEAALRLRPAFPEALNNLSELMILLEKPEEALAITGRLLQLDSGHAGGLSNRGGALLALGRPQEALECLDRALRTNPAMPRALTNKSQALAKLRRYDDALACADHAARLHPESADALITRGNILSEMRNLDAAILDFDRVIERIPDHPQALVSRGAALFHSGHYESARRDFEAAIRIKRATDMTISQAHLSLATMHLLNGEFEQGWPHFAWRWGTRDFQEAFPGFTQPRWDGTATDSHVLLWPEQGIGDQILYASMLAEAATFTGGLTVAIDPRLHPLLRRSFAGCELTTVETALEQGGFDYQLSMGDLGSFFRRSVDDCLKNRKAYLKADAERSGNLRKELLSTKQGLICGLSWSSKHNIVGDRKTIALSDLLPVLELPDVQFVDLQYGDTTEERSELARTSGQQITHLASVDPWHDIDGLAALINACDVVVTVSNTTAHLAGALGKAVFLMLPRSIGRFWWWQASRTDSLWYPNVRIFRQAVDGEWTDVLADVRKALAALPTPASNHSS